MKDINTKYIGWISYYRKSLANPIINRNKDSWCLWTKLLLIVAHRGYKTYFGGGECTVGSGQVVTTRKFLSELCDIPESNIHRNLRLFEKVGMIIQKTTNKERLITIKNWSAYQKNTRKPRKGKDSDKITREHEGNNEEGKSGKNIKKSVDIPLSNNTNNADNKNNINKHIDRFSKIKNYQSFYEFLVKYYGLNERQAKVISEDSDYGWFSKSKLCQVAHPKHEKIKNMAAYVWTVYQNYKKGIKPPPLSKIHPTPSFLEGVVYKEQSLEDILKSFNK
ncbi:MAG: hypothetical protein WCW25_03250 [Patescibacteria group bacterium]|jgi:hypothetical protein